MVVLETPLVTAVCEEENLNLVEFYNIEALYSLEEDVVVEFVLKKEVKGSTFDWIGIFREEWNTFECFLTFQRGLGSAVDPAFPRRRSVKFSFSREIVGSVLFDFRYQFVYINKYLDILGVSPFFQFILPLKNYLSKEQTVAPISKSMTLAEEMLMSENPYGGKNHVATCRLHKAEMLKNTVTTCTHCRPCGHDYYNIKEKVDLCYFECMRLGERLSDLECEVAMHTLKVKPRNRTDPVLPDKCANQVDIDVCTSKFSMNPRNEIEVRTDVDQSGKVFKDENVRNNLHLWLHHEEDQQDELSSYQDKSSSKNDMPLLPNKNEIGLRSSSYPPDGREDNSTLYPWSLHELRKCSSDGKLNCCEPVSSPSDGDSALVLKAIIGRQEERIRHLTQLLNKTDNGVREHIVDEVPAQEEEVVKLVRTEQRMLAQIMRINNNCQEYSNEEELRQKQKIHSNNLI